MPRQDVPYGGAICRLKERIAEIWDKLGEKLHSINGVEGDGAGNVEIVSGNDAILIANDQVGHRVEVSLDSSKLPSAAVSSVNGQSGAVMLDAGNIPSEGNSNVQTDLDTNKAAINDCFDSITSEQLARQNADNTLQGNINAVQASIPGAAAAAVSNDPTVAQLAADVPGKLDKISSGSVLKAYSHTGAAQGETPVVNGVDANSIGLRDGNGRMQAADPAVGATDKTLVTANWVSQTGDTAANNLLHRTGNEVVFNRKNAAFIANNFCEIDAFATSRKGWHKIYTITSTQRWMGVLTISNVSNAYNLGRGGLKEIFVMIETQSSAKLYWKTNIGANINIKVTYNGSVWEIWYNAPIYVRSYLQLDTMCYIWNATDSTFKLDPSWEDVVNEPASADYQVYIDTVENP